MSSVLFHLLTLNLWVHISKPPSPPYLSSQAMEEISAKTSLQLSEKLPPECHTVYGREVCFDLTSPWLSPSRPVVKAPFSPEELDTRFTLFTRHSDTVPLNPNNLTSLMCSPFIREAPIRVLTHGYLVDGNVKWIQQLRDELLRESNTNVIVLDWGLGSKPPYTQAIANMRTVAGQMAQLIHIFNRDMDIPTNAWHLIGHSLGAHLFGLVGANLQEWHGVSVARITGLDPAEPYFKDSDEVTRLDPEDAMFVDVIHTDDTPLLGFPMSLGITHPIGHLDFYPNGGDQQPGCDNAKCQHNRAITYFLESVRQSCQMLAIACPSYEQFLQGSCWGCVRPHACSEMGLSATPLKVPAMTRLFSLTYENSPHCGFHYRISVEVRNSTESIKHDGEFAILSLRMKGNKDVFQPVNLSEKSFYYGAGNVHRRILLSADLGDIREVGVTFIYPDSVFTIFAWRLGRPRIYLHSVTIESLALNGKGKRWIFCFQDDFQTSGAEYILIQKSVCE